jgi:hypothetical protein
VNNPSKQKLKTLEILYAALVILIVLHRKNKTYIIVVKKSFAIKISLVDDWNLLVGLVRALQMQKITKRN